MLNQFIHFYQVLVTRWQSDSPAFFRRLGRFFVWLTAFSGLATPQIQQLIVGITGFGLAVPVWVNTAATYVAVAGLVGKFVTALTVDPDCLPRPKYEALKDPSKAANV